VKGIQQASEKLEMLGSLIDSILKVPLKVPLSFEIQKHTLRVWLDKGAGQSEAQRTPVSGQYIVAALHMVP